MISLLNIINTIKHFLHLIWRRIIDDRLLTSAASLAYTTTLALIPLITVVFFFLSLFVFATFTEVTTIFKQFIIENLAPATKETIEPYIEQFIANTNRMTIIGIGGLIATSLLLINSIYNTLNIIWRTTRRRSFFYSLTIYWAILTLGPLLAGVSIAISSYIFSLHFISETEVVTLFIRILPFLLSVLGFWLLYCIVPTEPVPLLESTIGAILASILFELAKKGFTIYITSFSTYQLIYGVLSSFPILLVWIYFSWCIILFGAEFAATLVEFKQTKPHKQIKRSGS